MIIKVNIIIHSIHGHCLALAKELKIGAESIENIEVNIFKVQETNTPEIIESMGATEKIKLLENIPLASNQNLIEADAILLGAPTYFGTPSSQLMSFLNGFGNEWVNGLLIGKVGSSFTSTSEQNGGAETTLQNLNTFFFHQGMLIASLPSPLKIKEMHIEDKPVGGYCYGASTIAGGFNNITLSDEEKSIARHQGKHVALITKELCIGRMTLSNINS